MKFKAILVTILRFVAAILLIQTLYFKFTAHPESVDIFTRLGMEPWGRIGTGILELVAAVLLLNVRWVIWGAGLAAALMAGAVFFHLTKLGINVGGDPLLFIYAVMVFVCSVILLFIYRARIFQMLGTAKSRT